MKKRKGIGSLLMLLVFALCFHAWVVQPMNENNTVLALAAEPNEQQDSSGYYLAVGGEKYDSTSEGYELKKDSVTVIIANDNGFPDDMTVDYVISGADENFIKIERKTNAAGIPYIEVSRLAPGDPIITVTVTIPQKDENGVITTSKVLTFSCKILIGIEILTDLDHNHNVLYDKNSSTPVMVFTGTDDKPKQVKVQLYGENANKEFDYSTLYLDTDNHNVAVVDEYGNVKPVGAGITKLTAKIKADNGLAYDKAADETYIVVQPKASFKEDNQYAGYEQNPQMQKVESDSYELYVNTAAADNLNWKVYKYSYNTKSNKPTMELVDEDDYDIVANKLVFHDVKAGTYRILGYIKDKDGIFEFYNQADKDVIHNASNTEKTKTCYYVETEVLVPFRFTKESLEMNVGDMFDVMTNSNIPNVNLFSYESGNSYVLRQDKKSDSMFTALAMGSATLTVKPKLKAHELFPSKEDTPYDYELDTNGYSIPVSVINGFTLSLDYDMVTIYTGGSIKLQPSIKETDIIWESSDEKIATVDGDGLVTAKNVEGRVVITAKQEINGVIKCASCELYVLKTVTEITLKADTNIINVDGNLDIFADFNPVPTKPVELHWRVSDDSIIGIEREYDESVRIVGLNPGKAVVTAINQDNVVVGFYEVIVKTPVEKVKINEPVSTIRVGDTVQFTATIEPADATYQDVTWRIYGDNVGSIGATDGKIKITAAGTATVVCTSNDNKDAYAEYTFTVEQRVGGIKLDKTSLEMYVGDREQIIATITPETASNKKLIWKVIDPQVASVKDGVVTAVGIGKTEIFVQTEDGNHLGICTVEVIQFPVEVKLATSELTLNVGESFTLDVMLTPADSLDTSLVWEIIDGSDKVSVNAKGKVTALKTGQAIVSVKAFNGEGYTDDSRCKITVLAAVEGISIDPETVELELGETFELKPVFEPENATNVDVEWASSDEETVTVDENGVITAQAGGMAVITAVTEDGGYTAMCIVKVQEPVTTIILTPEKYKLGLGNKLDLKAEITNPKASSKELKWTSSNSKVVSVDKNGRITANKLGKATITVAATDGSGVEAYCEIEVVQEVTSISLNYTSKTVIQGESFALRATVSPSDATYQTPIWESDNTDVAIVDEKGVVTALTPGTAWITATANDSSGKVTKCHVTVIPLIGASGITALETEIVLMPGEKKTVVVKMTPANTTDGMTWISQDESVAKVNSSTGEITAVSSGTTTITVMSDSGKKATIKVIVVGLSRTSLTMKYYSGSIQLYVEGTTSKVRWYSSDESVAVVSANGTVSTRGIGTADIEAVVNGRTLVCKVTVVGY